MDFCPRPLHKGAMRRILLLALALSACGEPVRDDHFTNRVEPAAIPPGAPVQHKVAVRIGERGPGFNACAWAGTTRGVRPAGALPVREAPFESAREAGTIAAGGRFFVCTRSHDQKWLGVVFDESGVLDERCGVTTPITARRPYDGPCRSGWVASAFVRLVAGVAQEPAANQSAGSPEGG